MDRSDAPGDAELDADLLRVCTAGSVDDGKSTLIGRLLYDTKSIMADTLEAVTETSARRGDGRLDLALLTDGLRAEREQGITIDVAYRYFATPKRTYILADTPGHAQYTRNMVTGASTADVAIVLIDARHGVVEQSRRHAAIASLLGIRQVIVAVNKMDLVGFDQRRFDDIAADVAVLAEQLADQFDGGLGEVSCIPIAALHGDNIVNPSPHMTWYGGPTLLDLLETVKVADRRASRPFRFPVQYVIRPQGTEHHDYRGYAGRLATGSVRVGEEVLVLPSGVRTTVSAIDTYDGPLDVAQAGQSVTIRLSAEVDVSRGDVLSRPDESPSVTRDHVATLCWLSGRPLVPGARVMLKHATRVTAAVVDAITDRLEVTSLERGQAETLLLNDLGSVRLRTAMPLCADPYLEDRTMGSFVLIDPATNDTIAAGMFR